MRLLVLRLLILLLLVLLFLILRLLILLLLILLLLLNLAELSKQASGEFGIHSRIAIALVRVDRIAEMTQRIFNSFDGFLHGVGWW